MSEKLPSQKKVPSTKRSLDYDIWALAGIIRNSERGSGVEVSLNYAPFTKLPLNFGGIYNIANSENKLTSHIALQWHFAFIGIEKGITEYFVINNKYTCPSISYVATAAIFYVSKTEMNCDQNFGNLPSRSYTLGLKWPFHLAGGWKFSM